MKRDDAALAEDAARAKNLASDKQTKAEFRDFQHADIRLRKLLRECGSSLIWVGTRIGAFVILIRVYDLVAPKADIWMSPDQIQALDNIFVSGLVGALIGKGVSRAIPDKD